MGKHSIQIHIHVNIWPIRIWSSENLLLMIPIRCRHRLYRLIKYDFQRGTYPNAEAIFTGDFQNSLKFPFITPWTIHIISRDFSGGQRGPLEIILSLALGLNYKLSFSHQLYSTVSWSTAPSVFLKILICPCLIEFLDIFLISTYLYLSYKTWSYFSIQ